MGYYCIVEKITTTPQKINCSVRILTIRTATWLVKSRVKSGNQADTMVAGTIIHVGRLTMETLIFQ